MRLAFLILVLFLHGGLSLSSQPLCHVEKYDEADGVPSSHVTQLLQDDMGFLWFATWNGLCRYDGYDFQTFKARVGDGCHMTTDRLRNIDLLPTRQILCQVDEQYYVFDLQTYRFRDLTVSEQQQLKSEVGKHRRSRSLQRKPFSWTDSHQTQWTLSGDGRLTYRHAADSLDVVYPLTQPFRTLTFAMADRQGNLWALDYGSIYKFCTDVQRTRRLPIEPRAEVKCLFDDYRGHYWVATKDDEALRIYDSRTEQLLGYLGADGRVHTAYTRFGAAVYCMYESRDGTLWLGTKPKGLFRLRPTASGAYQVDHFLQLPCPDVYDIAADRFGRLWVATLGGGLCYTTEPDADSPRFIVPKGYPVDAAPRARYLLFTSRDYLLAATSSGLLVARLTADAEAMQFRLHQREPDRKTSLSSSATMDVVQCHEGPLLVSTESGGINVLENASLEDSVLSFRHLSEQFHAQSGDIVQSLVPFRDGGYLAVGSHLVTVLDSTLQGRVLDARSFNGAYRFSEAHPMQLRNGKWLFGLTDGAFVTVDSLLCQQAYQPRVVLTSIAVQGGDNDYAIANADSLVLQPSERSVIVRFAALDYSAPNRISYAFRLLPNEHWNYIGHDRSATLLDLEPGTYQLEVRSTDADGQWADNLRRLVIVVKPTFWESVWGRLLIVLLLVSVLGVIAYTLLYIRRIKRKQHETLQKYMASIELHGDVSPAVAASPSPATESVTVADTSSSPAATPLSANVKEDDVLDPVLERVMSFIEENIANSEASVGDMAAAAATSRSGLQRKVKQAMGITPQDLLREARIKRAARLLLQTDKTVAEIAYACGFSDPKYFSRCFKQSTGQSPTEYKNAP